ncbi:MAG: enoyl-CoA hydratase/isomerase family protein [Planctomycetota bacterium]|nr:enoyl-CoA hydratase/isomerase family protein [Planctomycetota bacterium]
MTTALFQLAQDPESKICTLTLAAIPEGPVVVLNKAVLAALEATISEVERTKPTGLILASSGRVWVAGADLKEIMGLSDAELRDYLRFGQHVFGRLSRLPCPTVAAIHGAVLGGGLELAMHCDHLIAAAPLGTAEKPAKPYAVGLPEAGLSICPGWGGTNLLPARMDAAHAIELTATGRTMDVNAACAAGVAAGPVPADTLLSEAKAWIRGHPKASPRQQPVCIGEASRRELVRSALGIARGRIGPGEAAAAVLECVQIGVDKGWLAALDAEREHLIRLRSTPAGRGAIEAFFARK